MTYTRRCKQHNLLDTAGHPVEEGKRKTRAGVELFLIFLVKNHSKINRTQFRQAFFLAELRQHPFGGPRREEKGDANLALGAHGTKSLLHKADPIVARKYARKRENNSCYGFLAA